MRLSWPLVNRLRLNPQFVVAMQGQSVSHRFKQRHAETVIHTRHHERIAAPIEVIDVRDVLDNLDRGLGACQPLPAPDSR